MPLSNLQRQHCNPVVGKHCLMEQQEADDAAEGKPWQHAGSTKLFLATTIPCQLENPALQSNGRLVAGVGGGGVGGCGGG